MHAGRPVKSALQKGFRLSRDAVDGDGKEQPNMRLGGVKPRDLLEPVSDAIATHAPKATAIALRSKITKAMSKGRDVVVDGIRQKAEADLIKRLGGHLVAVDTGRTPDPSKPMDLRAAELIADHVVSAPSGKKKELRGAVDALMHKLMGAE
jgi:hypothetical protein